MQELAPVLDGQGGSGGGVEWQQLGASDSWEFVLPTQQWELFQSM
eukprot:SAG25_NODE_540_length_7084_cov_4.278454_3_plen_45_part_00